MPALWEQDQQLEVEQVNFCNGSIHTCYMYSLDDIIYVTQTKTDPHRPSQTLTDEEQSHSDAANTTKLIFHFCYVMSVYKATPPVAR